MSSTTTSASVRHACQHAQLPRRCGASTSSPARCNRAPSAPCHSVDRDKGLCLRLQPGREGGAGDRAGGEEGGMTQSLVAPSAPLPLSVHLSLPKERKGTVSGRRTDGRRVVAEPTKERTERTNGNATQRNATQRNATQCTTTKERTNKRRNERTNERTESTSSSAVRPSIAQSPL